MYYTVCGFPQEENSGLIGFMDLWIISVGISSAGV